MPPNWVSAVVERLKWTTEILTSFDRTEQRAGWRERPARSLEYEFLINHDDLPFTEAIIYALQASEVLVDLPIWSDSRRLGANLPAESSVIPLVTDGLDYGSPGRVAIVASESLFEVLDLDSFTATELLLTNATRFDWSQGARIVPVRSGLMPLSLSLGRPTDRGCTGSIRYDLTDPGWPILPALVADVYRSLDVFPFRPDRSEEISERYTVFRTRFESMGGTVAVFPRRDRPEIGKAPRFVFKGRDEIQQLRAWLHRCAGQRKRFWAPTFMSNLELYQDADAAHDYLVLKSVRGHQLYGHPHGPETEETTAYRNPGRRDIEIRQSTGAAPIRRRIQSWHEISQGVDQILLDSAVGVDLTAGVAIIEFLSEQRFAADELELRWITDDLVETSLPMRSL